MGNVPKINLNDTQLIAELRQIYPSSSDETPDEERCRLACMKFGDTVSLLTEFIPEILNHFQGFLGGLARAEHACIDQTVYFYELNVKTKMFHEDPYKNGSNITRMNFCRADHADDLIYVFGLPFIPNFQIPIGRYFSEEEKELSKRMMKSWSNFAKLEKPGWEPFETSTKIIHEFNTPNDITKSANDETYKKRLKFWQKEYNNSINI